MTDWGSVTVGRITLREVFDVQETGLTLNLSGQEAHPDLTRSEVYARHANLVALDKRQGAVLPVTFTDKPERGGYFQVQSVTADLVEYPGDMVTTSWQIHLDRIGYEADTDLQSRLTGVARLNDFSLSGERWHAPPIGHYAYHTGTTSPSTMTRTGADGDMTLYRSVPSGISPRWGCAPGDYLAGRVRVLDGTVELEGTDHTIDAGDWSLSNALVNVTPGGSGTLDIQAYTGGAWHSKQWTVSNGSAIPASGWSAATLLRNDPEMAVLRLVGGTQPGRTTLDLTLRRGSRFVEGYLQHTSSVTLAVHLTAAETNANTAASGYNTATNNDADGNRYACGSARTFTTHANGGVSKATATSLDFWAGAVAAGGSAVSGDAATDLRNMYIACLPELVYGVRR